MILYFQRELFIFCIEYEHSKNIHLEINAPSEIILTQCGIVRSSEGRGSDLCLTQSLRTLRVPNDACTVR